MATDSARSPSPSPIAKFGKFRRSKKSKNDNASAQSLVSVGDDSAGAAVSRVSTDSIVDKLRSSRRSSEDPQSATTDSPRRLSKLLPGKLKRRKGSAATGDSDEKASSHLSTDDQRLSRQASSTSLGKTNSVHSSLMTEDSDHHNNGESSPQLPPIRPTISPHVSHAGYLTVSSPHINAHTDLQITTSPVTDDGTPSPADSTPQHKDNPVHDETPVLKNPFNQQENTVERPSPSDQAKQTDLVPSAGRETPVPAARTVEAIDERGRVSQSRRAVTEPSAAKSSPKLASINTARRPSTPPNEPASAEAPETLVTPPTPIQSSPDKKSPTKSTPGSATRNRPKPFHIPALTPAKSTTSLSGPSILTPPAEEYKTPGGSLTSPTTGGFFSSFFTAAQNATNTFSNPFQNPGTKPKPDTSVKSAGKALPQVLGTDQDTSAANPALARIRVEEPEPSPMSSTFTVEKEQAVRPSTADNMSVRTDEASAASAISTAYEKPVITAIAQAQGIGRPQSVASQSSLLTDQSPSRPPPAPQEQNHDIKRSGSIRSWLSDRKRNRKRGSSVGTANTLGTTASQANTLAPTQSISSAAAPRPTGFAVANAKRNKDFHQLFRSVPEDDYLIEDYSAALQRDILLHGRFYVSEGHICFSSNILGWVTNLVISFDEIQSIEKKNTAIVFPNALAIQTAHARSVFASFVMRDSTYDLLLGIWKTTHPNLRILPNGVSLGGSPSIDQTEKGDTTSSSDSEDGSDDVYDEDAENDDDLLSVTEAGANGSIAGSDVGDVNAAPRKASTMPTGISPPATGAVSKAAEGDSSAVAGIGTGTDFPGPTSHDPSECSDSATHYDRPLIDITMPAPLGKIYSLFFGPQSGPFMKKWLVDDQKSRELSYDDTPTGLNEANRTFTYSYIKPLNAPVGPRQTKCIVTATLQSFDLDKAISVDCSTQTPDVPSGNIFTTKTRYCLMWGPGNTTRMVANCTIEWTGKSWLKGPIEKGANDGQTQYVKDLVAALKAAVATRAPAKAVKGRKGKRGAAKAEEEVVVAAAKVVEKEENWGLFEPLRPSLGPLVGFIRPFFTPQIVISVMFVLLVQSWFFGFSPRRDAAGGSGIGYAGVSGNGAERIAAYEAMWAREESDLWDWLEDRVGLEKGVYIPARDGGDKRRKAKAVKGLVDEKMKDREVREAIRITEEKLKVLKEAVNHKEM